MSLDELATIMFLVCGKGFSDAAEDCRNVLINCAVKYEKEITRENVEICVKRAEKMK